MPAVSETISRRVAIVEDHQLLAEALDLALSAQGYDVRRVDVADRPQPHGSLLAAVLRLRARIVLLDLDLGWFGDGTTLIAPVVRSGSKVVVMTGSTDRAHWGEAIGRGASVVVSKARPLTEIIATVRRVHQGQPVLTLRERDELLGAWRDRVAETGSITARLDRLTPREAAVLRELMNGRTVQEIAAASVVSTATVRTQVKSILAKLEVSSQVAAVGLAHRVAGHTGRP